MGFHSEVHTWKWDFALKFALDTTIQATTVRVKIIIGSLVIIENLFPPNCRYRYRLEIRMNSFNYHYCRRLGVRSHPFISIDPNYRLESHLN